MSAQAIYLHAGLPKTGSSSIQETAFHERLKLRRWGIRYWGIGANHGWPLAVALGLGDHGNDFDRRRAPDKVVKYGEPETVRRNLQDEARLAANKFVLSAERLSSLNSRQLEDLANLLSAASTNIQVIAYVREPRGWLTSIVQQKLKIGMSAEEAVAQYRVLPYRTRLQTLMNVFGERHVKLRAYRTQWDEFGIFGDFLEAMGEAPSLAREFPARWSNVSMSARGAGLLDALNRIARETGQAQNFNWLRLKYVAPHFRGPGLRLDPAVLDRVVEDNREQLAWVSDRLGTDILALPSTIREEPALVHPIDEDMARFIFAIAADLTRLHAEARDARQGEDQEARARSALPSGDARPSRPPAQGVP